MKILPRKKLTTQQKKTEAEDNKNGINTAAQKEHALSLETLWSSVLTSPKTSSKRLIKVRTFPCRDKFRHVSLLGTYS